MFPFQIPFQIDRPTVIPALEGKIVNQIHCGEFHTLFLLNSGELYSCGNNENGQLGHSKRTTRPGSYFSVICSPNLVYGVKVMFIF